MRRILILSLALSGAAQANQQNECDQPHGCAADLNDETSLLQVTKNVIHRRTEAEELDELFMFDAEDIRASDGVRGMSESEASAQELSEMAKICIKDEVIRDGNGPRYRRNNAKRAMLGSLGILGWCMTCSASDYEFKGAPSGKEIEPFDQKIKMISHITMTKSEQNDFSAAAKADVGKIAGEVGKIAGKAGEAAGGIAGKLANVNVAVEGSLGSTSNSQTGIKADILGFSDIYQLVEDINNDPKELNRILAAKKKDKSQRIVTQVMKLSDQMDSSGDGCFSSSGKIAATDAVSLSHKMKNCDQYQHSLSSGTIIGYQLGKFVFDDDKNPTKVVDIDRDHVCGRANVLCQCWNWR